MGGSALIGGGQRGSPYGTDLSFNAVFVQAPAQNTGEVVTEGWRKIRAARERKQERLCETRQALSATPPTQPSHPPKQ